VATELHVIVARVLDLPAGDVHDEMGPKTVGQWTSLRHIQLIAAVEDAYGIRLNPREIRSVRSVSQLRALVLSKNGTV
jgi:acyl carrier protein